MPTEFPPFDPTAINAMPIARHLGIEVTSAGDGEAVVETTVAPFHLNTRGIAHGGIVPFLVDACGTTGVLTLVPGSAVSTLSLQVDFLAACGPGAHLVAHARVEQLTGRTGYAAVRVIGDCAETIALGRVTCAVRPLPADNALPHSAGQGGEG